MNKCKNCNTETKNNNFCSNKCQGEYRIRSLYESGNGSLRTAKKYFKSITEYCCSECGISEWNGKELTLQIDHIDGNNKNNVVENFRYLCPNCHTQTDTWGTKNASDEGKERMKTNKRSGSSVG